MFVVSFYEFLFTWTSLTTAYPAFSRSRCRRPVNQPRAANVSLDERSKVPPIAVANLAPLRFEFFDDRRLGCCSSDAGCFLEAIFVLRVGNFLTSRTICADARHDAL
jgi:hypothetical protein